MNELTTTQETALATSAPVLDVLSSMVKMKPSRLDLIQYTSRKLGVIPGRYRDSGTGEHFTEITVVPLDIRKGRVMYADKSDFSKPPVCKSFDTIKPSPYVELPQAPTCKECKFSKWVKAAGKNIRPACNETYSLLTILKDSELPYWLKFSGSSIKLFLEFLENLEKDRVKVNSKTGRKPNLWEYYFTIQPQEVITQSGKFFVPVFVNPKRVEDPNLFGPFYQQYVLNARLSEEDVEDDVDVKLDEVVSPSGAADNGPSVHQAEFVDA